MMTINFNVTGSERKRLADCIAGFLGCDKEYLGAPTFAYQAGYIEISKDGSITFDDRADSAETEALLGMLEKEGFNAGPAEEVHEMPAGFTITMPTENISAGNLIKLIEAKGHLIKKALGIDALPINIGEDSVSFPWFSVMPEPAEAAACTKLIGAMCRMSRNQKRVTATERETDNEKYAFRCFLLRLGFIGAEYKEDRKILLRNLTGSSAFKSGRKGDAGDEVSG